MEKLFGTLDRKIVHCDLEMALLDAVPSYCKL